MRKNRFVRLATVLGLAASLAVALPVFAQTSQQGQRGRGWGGPGGTNHPDNIPAVFGTVTAINGSTLTVNAEMKMRPRPENDGDIASTTATTTIYSVDASNAKIYKGNSTSTVSVSDVAVGDTVMVEGTINGLTVTATVIHDGAIPTGRSGSDKGDFGRNASSSAQHPTLPIQGNGEPVIAGTVTVINGSTLTVANTSNVTYIVDVSSSTVIKNGTSTTIGSIAVGDNLIVQGTVNSTSVTASSVIDQGAKNGSVSSNNASSSGPRGGFGGIFRAIGNFFYKLFGF